MDNTFLGGLLRTLRIVLLGDSLRRIFQSARMVPLRNDALLALVLWAAGVWVFYRLYSRRERDGRSYLFFGVAFVLTGLALTELWLHVSREFFGWIFSAAILSLTVYSAARMQTEPTPASRDILTMEGGVAVFLLTLLLVSVGRMEWSFALPAALSAAIGLGLVLSHRLSGITGENGRAVGKALTILIPSAGAVGLTALAFARWGSEPYARGLTALGRGVWAVIKTLGRWICLFIQWLASLLPDPGQELPPMEPVAGIPAEQLSEEAPVNVAGILLGGLLIALAATVLFLLFRTLRGRRLGGRSRPRNVQSVRRQRLPLPARLRAVWAQLLRSVRFLVRRWKSRGTPRELYYTLLKKGERAGCGLRPGETPMACVRRLGELLPEPDADRATQRLAAALERELYAGGSAETLSREEQRTLRRMARRLPAYRKGRRRHC